MSNDKATKSPKHNQNKWSQNNYPYQVDYNDHFETPLIAYQDIAPILDWLAQGTPRKDHKIYDPYYCNGATITLMKQLGFHTILHQKRDFYQDIQNQTIPPHDTFLTNPPYSDDHKQKCLEFALKQLRTQNIPFLCLMPNYVASKEYFRALAAPDEVCYIVPNQPYEYSHPEGTGKEVPPFASIWFCGIGAQRKAQLEEFWNHRQLVLSESSPNDNKPRLILTLDDLKTAGAIPTQKRGNPRQRNKRKQQPQQPQRVTMKEIRTTASSSSRTKDTTCTTPPPDRKTKPSKYRDGNGQRKKRRF